MKDYIVLYLTVGLPVSVACSMAWSKEPFIRRILLALCAWAIWPFFPIAIAKEWWAIKRLTEVCFWCREEVTNYANPNKRQAWIDHFLHKCKKHPLRGQLEEVLKGKEQP